MDTGGKINSEAKFPCMRILPLTVAPTVFLGKIPRLTLPNQNQVAGVDLQGSVPSTPGSDFEEIDEGFPSNYTALETDTREIIDVFFKNVTGLSSSSSSGGRKQVLSTMKRVVDSLIMKHELAYKGMIKRLDLEDKEDVSFVRTVAKELFGDGITNWGRIASLLAFGAVVCKYQNDRGRSQCVGLVGNEISSYLLSAQQDWLLKNKAWDGFVEFFHVTDTEAVVRNTLMAIGSVATVSAALAYWIR